MDGSRKLPRLSSALLLLPLLLPASVADEYFATIGYGECVNAAGKQLHKTTVPLKSAAGIDTCRNLCANEKYGTAVPCYAYSAPTAATLEATGPRSTCILYGIKKSAAQPPTTGDGQWGLTCYGKGIDIISMLKLGHTVFKDQGVAFDMGSATAWRTCSVLDSPAKYGFCGKFDCSPWRAYIARGQTGGDLSGVMEGGELVIAKKNVWWIQGGCCKDRNGKPVLYDGIYKRISMGRGSDEVEACRGLCIEDNRCTAVWYDDLGMFKRAAWCNLIHADTTGWDNEHGKGDDVIKDNCKQQKDTCNLKVYQDGAPGRSFQDACKPVTNVPVTPPTTTPPTTTPPTTTATLLAVGSQCLTNAACETGDCRTACCLRTVNDPDCIQCGPTGYCQKCKTGYMMLAGKGCTIWEGVLSTPPIDLQLTGATSQPPTAPTQIKPTPLVATTTATPWASVPAATLGGATVAQHTSTTAEVGSTSPTTAAGVGAMATTQAASYANASNTANASGVGDGNTTGVGTGTGMGTGTGTGTGTDTGKDLEASPLPTAAAGTNQAGAGDPGLTAVGVVSNLTTATTVASTDGSNGAVLIISIAFAAAIVCVLCVCAACVAKRSGKGPCSRAKEKKSEGIPLAIGTRTFAMQDNSYQGARGAPSDSGHGDVAAGTSGGTCSIPHQKGQDADGGDIIDYEVEFEGGATDLLPGPEVYVDESQQQHIQTAANGVGYAVPLTTPDETYAAAGGAGYYGDALTTRPVEGEPEYNMPQESDSCYANPADQPTVGITGTGGYLHVGGTDGQGEGGGRARSGSVYAGFQGDTGIADTTC